MKEHNALLFNGIILIVLGTAGYFMSDAKSATAFIGPAIGVILVILSGPVKNNNKTAAHIGAVLTLIAVVAFFIVGLKRNNTYVIIMAVTSLLSMIMLIMGFIRRKKEREAAGV
jgi:choline-glycine betaine transporter